MNREIEWRIDHSNNRLVRSGLYSFYAAIGVMGSIGLFGLLLILYRAINEGDIWPLVLILAILLVAGPISIRTALAFYNSDRDEWQVLTKVYDPAQNPSEPLEERIAPYYTFPRVATVMGISAVFTIVLMIIGGWPIVPTLVVLFGWTALTSVIGSWGRIDLDKPHMQTYGGEIPLEHVAGYRSVRIGSIVFCWISYTSGDLAVSRRSLLTVPPDAFEAFETVVQEVATEPVRSTSGDTAIITVAGVFGLLFLLLAFGIALVSAIPWVIRAYLAVMIGLFAIIFLGISAVHVRPKLMK